ncbi:hypothetical protein Tco_0992791 [Tanacetum coccineum]|uniref:Uncharacterized protein n=1 Tax=Tanacetum coccineum TaxID=301880 RepID=A0ABQ5F3D2_9ASTR
MSETEPIVPTSILLSLITYYGHNHQWKPNHNCSASPSCSAPKTSLAANARRNNEKALNILLSAIPDRHLLSFHDAVDARSLWKAIKARFGGNEASKKMQKNLLKQQFETFTIGSREELDSAYERFQHILSMLELHDATVSIEDANLKFLRSLPSVWHVVATMIRGTGLDESQSSTLKQSTAEPTNIPKGYTQAASSKVPTASNYASHSDEIICSFFSQQASMPTTHDDEDLLQIDEDAMEEIDIRWQVAMITGKDKEVYEEDRNQLISSQRMGSLLTTKIEYVLGDFDWSIKMMIQPVSLSLMATNSRNILKEKDLKLEDKQKGIRSSLKERDDFQSKYLRNGHKALVLQNEVLNKQRYVSDKSCIGFGIESSSSMESDILTDSVYENFKREKAYKAVPPPTDWVDSDDEETDVSESQKETAFNSENSETSFENSPNHLIKDCNLHERTFKQTQTHKPKRTQGSRETRPVWNNIQRVNHSNFSRNSRYPHQRRSFNPSAVLTRDGLISTARPTMTQTVPSKSTANVTYQGTARSRVPQAVLSRSTDGSYYPRMDNRRPRISSYSPSSRSSNPRTIYRPQRPKKIVKSIWVKKGSTVGSQAVLSQPISPLEMILKEEDSQGKGDNQDTCLDIEKRVSYVEDLNVLDLKNIIPSGGVTFLLQRQQMIRCFYGTEDWGIKSQNINQVGSRQSGLLAKSIFLGVFLGYKMRHMDRLHDLIVGLEKQATTSSETIRCDNGTSSKNQLMNEFCAKKGNQEELSIARTPQANGIQKERNGLS